MNTRDFLKTLLLVGVAPSVLIPKFPDCQRWRKTASTGLWVLNPAYEAARYELLFSTDPKFESPPKIYLRELKGEHKGWRPQNTVSEAYPLRYDRNPFPMTRGAVADFSNAIPPFIQL
jgi:hypothetical protein